MRGWVVSKLARWVGGVVLVAAFLGACAPAEAPKDRAAGGRRTGRRAGRRAGLGRAGGSSAAQAGGTLTLAFPSTDAGDVRSLDPQVDGSTYSNTILPGPLRLA